MQDISCCSSKGNSDWEAEYLTAKAVNKKPDGSRKRNTTSSSANTKRKTTGSSSSTRSAAVSAKKNASGTATKAARKPKPEKEMERPMIPEERTSPLLIQEAVLWGIIAVGIFLFISNFGFGGFLGGVLSDVGFGIFGWMAYLFPVLLVFFTAFLMSNRGSAIAGVKVCFRSDPVSDCVQFFRAGTRRGI